MTKQSTTIELTRVMRISWPPGSRMKRALFAIGLVAVLAAAVVTLYWYIQFKLAERTIMAVRTVETWLDCQECSPDQLERVAELAPEVIPVLSKILYEGPSELKRTEHQTSLESQFDLLQQSGAKHIMNKQEFVNTYQEKYVVGKQIRAAQAIAAIGGKDARLALFKVLCNGRGRPLSQPVKDEVQRLLEKLGEC